MNKQFLMLVALPLAGMLGAGTAGAHHGIFEFDHDAEVELSGTITGIDFVNPHTWLHLDVGDDAGSVTAWRCEMRAATVLRRSGWSQDMFIAGESVTVTGSPGKSEPNECYLGTITFADGRSFNRYSQIDDEKPVSPSSRPLRLANGDPNISGDWAAEQRVLTDERGVSGSFVLLSVAERVRAGDVSDEVKPMLAPFPGSRGHTDIGLEAFDKAEGLTEAGMALYREHDLEADNPRYRCEATSIIFDWDFDYHANRIVQLPGQILLRYGFMDLERVIHMDMSEHPEAIEPSRAGHSIGRWEDNVLVVDTVGIARGLISTTGFDGFVPNSDQVHIVERFVLNEEMNTLTRSYVVEDPIYLAEPITDTDTVKLTDYPFEPYDCDDKLYGATASGGN